MLRIDKTVLYRYRPMVEKPSPVPILLTYALVGRYTMMDLQEDRSLVRNLLRAGLDVYVVDWGHPSRADRFAGLDDYVNDYLAACVDEMCRRHGVGAINLLGVCQGGVLSLCYTALHPTRIRNLITTVTPVDFHADQAENRIDRGFMNVWARSLRAGRHRPAGRSAGHRAGRVRGLPVLADDAGPQPDQVQSRPPGRGRRPSQAAQLPAHGALARRPAAPAGRGLAPVAEGALPGQQADQGRVRPGRPHRAAEGHHLPGAQHLHRDRPHHPARDVPGRCADGSAARTIPRWSSRAAISASSSAPGRWASSASTIVDWLARR